MIRNPIKCLEIIMTKIGEILKIIAIKKLIILTNKIKYRKKWNFQIIIFVKRLNYWMVKKRNL
jgi:hypothetical protein